jgi:hypothetical protein
MRARKPIVTRLADMPSMPSNTASRSEEEAQAGRRFPAEIVLDEILQALADLSGLRHLTWRSSSRATSSVASRERPSQLSGRGGVVVVAASVDPTSAPAAGLPRGRTAARWRVALCEDQPSNSVAASAAVNRWALRPWDDALSDQKAGVRE